jgi:hypothetical protein
LRKFIPSSFCRGEGELKQASSYIVIRPLSYRDFRRGEFSLDYSSGTCDFYLDYILSNLGIKLDMHIHMCILCMRNFLFDFLEV